MVNISHTLTKMALSHCKFVLDLSHNIPVGKYLLQIVSKRYLFESVTFHIYIKAFVEVMFNSR